MLWKLLEDLVVAIHALWIAAVLLGPFLALRRPRLRAVHLAIILIPLGFTVLGMYCPLTYLETWFCFRQPPAVSYPGGFIANYLERWIYWDVPVQAIGAANLAWLALWTGVYVYMWRKEKKG